MGLRRAGGRSRSQRRSMARVQSSCSSRERGRRYSHRSHLSSCTHHGACTTQRHDSRCSPEAMLFSSMPRYHKERTSNSVNPSHSPLYQISRRALYVCQSGRPSTRLHNRRLSNSCNPYMTVQVGSLDAEKVDDGSYLQRMAHQLRNSALSSPSPIYALHAHTVHMYQRPHARIRPPKRLCRALADRIRDQLYRPCFSTAEPAGSCTSGCMTFAVRS